MAKVLAYTAPAAGHAQPCAGIVVELHRRGHDVRVRTRDTEAALLREVGVQSGPVDPRIESIEFDDWKARTFSGALDRVQRTYARRAQLEIPDLLRAIEEEDPDVLLVDVACEGAGFVAEASGRPWAQFCPHPPVFGSADAPPYGPGLRPATGAFTRARDRLFRRVGRRMADRHLPPLNALRAELRLEPLEHFEQTFLAADRCIIHTAEPYEYPRTDWPPNVRLVGPVHWEAPSAPPDWLGTETRPIVLVTASTVRQADESLIATALEALAGEDLAVVVTTGAHDPSAFPAPANARVEAFLPHGHVLRRAACVVAHGGQGITQKALAHGVPVCVVPFCRDQFEVARRVEQAEAGTRLHHKRLNPSRLRRAVMVAMRRSDGADRVRAAFATAGGASAAADAVEELTQRVERTPAQ